MKKLMAVTMLLVTVVGTVAMARSRKSSFERTNAVIDARLHELLMKANHTR
jgi:hypothetical protein